MWGGGLPPQRAAKLPDCAFMLKTSSYQISPLSPRHKNLTVRVQRRKRGPPPPLPLWPGGHSCASGSHCGCKETNHNIIDVSEMMEALTARASIQRGGVNLIFSFKSFLRPEAAAPAEASHGRNLQSALRRLRCTEAFPRLGSSAGSYGLWEQASGPWASGSRWSANTALDDNSSLKPAEGTAWRGQRAGVYEL